MSVRPSVCTSAVQQHGSNWTDIHDFYFHKSVQKIQVSLKADKDNGTLHEDRYVYSDVAISRNCF